MASMTKAQLAAENATLRAEVSTLRAQVEVLKEQRAVFSDALAYERNTKAEPAKPQTIKKAYPSIKDAMAACREYAQSKFNQRYVFTVCGSELVAKLRSAS